MAIYILNKVPYWLDLLTTNLTAETLCAFSDVLHTAIHMLVPLKSVKNSDIWQLSISHKKCCPMQVLALQRDIKL